MGGCRMIRKAKNELTSQRGVALVIALLMMVTFTLIGLASILTSTFEIKLSGNKRGSTDAFYSADSGIQIVKSNISNFDLPGKFVDEKYDPFTDPSNPNPTNASVTIHHDATQAGPPRGVGMSAIHFGFEHYVIESMGQDQSESTLVKAKTTAEEKVVRLVPTQQGGY
jgi:hypothetical protein